MNCSSLAACRAGTDPASRTAETTSRREEAKETRGNPDLARAYREHYINILRLGQMPPSVPVKFRDIEPRYGPGRQVARNEVIKLVTGHDR